MKNEISENLLKIRTDAGLSQGQLSEILGVGQMSISQYERGTCLPTVSTLKKYAKHFQTSIDDLVCFDSWINPKKEMPKVENSNFKKRVWIFGNSKMEFNCEGIYHNGKFYIDGQDVTRHVKRWRNIPKKAKI